MLAVCEYIYSEISLIQKIHYPGHILLGTDFFFINLTRLYGNLRSGTGNPKQGTKCPLSIESRFVNLEMLIIKWEMCQSILQVNLIS